MKKSFSVLLVIVALALMMIIPSRKILAAEQGILTLKASQSDGNINVSGTVSEGVLAVAVAVYKEGSTEPVTMKTTDVNNSYEFSTSVEVAKGDYIVKVANYNGGDFVEAKVTVDTEKDGKEDTSESPKAGDMFIVYGAVLGIAAITLIGSIVIKRKRSNK